MTQDARTQEDIAVSVRGVSKCFPVEGPARPGLWKRVFPWSAGSKQPFQALKNVSLDVPRGQTLGIVGRNGSGKTTLLKVICGILSPTAGEARIHGEVSALLDLGAGFDPEFSGMDNIFMNGTLMGFSKAHMDSRLQDILDFAGIGDFIHRPVKTYSSGMFVRLAFSVAIHADPDILVVDETLAVGDEAFRRKCFARINQIRRNGGTIILVSHSLNRVVELCGRALWLDQGEIILQGEPSRVVSEYERFTHAPIGLKERILGHFKQRQEQEPPRFSPVLAREIATQSARAYDSRGARIANPRILNQEGEETNTLALGCEYVFTYDVSFDRPCSLVRFGMMLKSQSGLELGGMVSHPKGHGLEQVEPGQRISPRFVFQCRLMPEVYFANCGVTGQVEGEETYLHRIVDAVMFRIMPQKDLLATGLADFTCSVDLMETSGNAGGNPDA